MNIINLINLINISEDKLISLKSTIKENQILTLYSSPSLEIQLYKHKGKVYEIIKNYGDKPFAELFAEMIKMSQIKNA